MVRGRDAANAQLAFVLENINESKGDSQNCRVTIIQCSKDNGSNPTDTLIDLIGYTVPLAECLTEK